MQGLRKMSIENIIQKSVSKQTNKAIEEHVSSHPKDMNAVQLLLKQYIIQSGAISSRKCTLGMTNQENTTKQLRSQHSKFKTEKHITSTCQLSICQIETVAITKMGIRNYDNMQNQDVILQDQIANKCKIYGVFDGHGQYGREIALTIKNIFQNFLTKYVQDIKNESSVFTIEAIIKKVLEKTNLYLLHYKTEEAQFSGATVLIVLITTTKIYSFNIGNCRVALAKYYENEKQLKGFQMTHDHTISRLDQRLRILSKNGIIQPFKNERGEFVGPDRIWAANQRYPGTYVTRTMGLSCANKLGITSDVEVNVVPYKECLKYVIIGSDGLWSVFQNNQIVSILQKDKSNNLTAHANYIMLEALKRWRQKNQLMDDVSIIIIRLVSE